jgi:predicted acylesterase/phospholipase RssA
MTPLRDVTLKPFGIQRCYTDNWGLILSSIAKNHRIGKDKICNTNAYERALNASLAKPFVFQNQFLCTISLLGFLCALCVWSS